MSVFTIDDADFYSPKSTLLNLSNTPQKTMVATSEPKPLNYESFVEKVEKAKLIRGNNVSSPPRYDLTIDDEQFIPLTRASSVSSANSSLMGLQKYFRNRPPRLTCRQRMTKLIKKTLSKIRDRRHKKHNPARFERKSKFAESLLETSSKHHFFGKEL